LDLNETKKQELAKKKYILLSTPKRFLEFLTSLKFNIENIQGLAIEELDFGFSFGYEEDLSKICTIFSKANIFKIMTCCNGSEEIDAMKAKFMTGALNLKMTEENDEEHEELVP